MDVLLGTVAALAIMFGLCGLSCVASNRWGKGTRPTTDKVILAKAKTVTLDADWRKVREMELYVYGAHYHRPDGTTSALGWEPVEKDKSQSTVDRVPEQQAQLSSLKHLCKFCQRRATWQSKVNGAWLCGTCRPCWCGYCDGRVNVHGEDAKALYQAQIDILARRSPPGCRLTGGS